MARSTGTASTGTASTGTASTADARAAERIERRVARVDAGAVRAALDAEGRAVIPGLLAAAECRALAARFEDDAAFRSSIDLARHRFGEHGRYRYFAAPVPAPVAALRRALYALLAPLATRWAERLRREARYPDTLDAFLRRCHAAGQRRPTPLLLHYDAGGYNCLHQDRYGDVAFPLQATLMLSAPGEDFDGGEFLLVEQRPRAQSRGEAIALERGACVVFANDERPVEGKRGDYRVRVRHGVSRVRRGTRRTLGVIFHDAR